MNIFVLIALCYLAAGIVFITRISGLEAIEESVTPPQNRDFTLRMVAGLAIAILWPLFLLEERVETTKSPMAMKLNN